jgi:hypothetical protein
VEATALASGANVSDVRAFNVTLFSVVADGSLTLALQAAGVNTTGAVLPVPPALGLQLNLAIQCPAGAVDATTGALLANTSTMLRSVSPGGALDASASLLANISARGGLGNISSVVVSLTPIVGAFALPGAHQPHARACSV